MDRPIGVLALVLVGCGGDEATTGDTGADAPTFTEVRDEILVPSCGASSCHGGGAGGLQLDEATAHASLVGAESDAVAGAVLVVSGDPDSSYLMEKLEGDPTSITGDLMPPPFGGLEPDKIEQIRAWIAAGAADD